MYDTMLDHSEVDVGVKIVGNPSLCIEKTNVTLTNKFLPNLDELTNYVRALCRGEPHRIYWRVTEFDYLPIYSYIGLKGALNMMYKPGIFVIRDEPTFMFTEFSEENLKTHPSKSAISEMSTNDIDNYDASSLFREIAESCDSINLTDIEILRCATRQSNEKKFFYDCLTSKSSPMFTKENLDVNRQLDILMRGFPEAKATKPVEISFAETKNISSAGTNSKGARKK